MRWPVLSLTGGGELPASRDTGRQAVAGEGMGMLRACLRQVLGEKGESRSAMLLLDAEVSLVRAPEIGCMPSLPEHSLRIDVPGPAYAELARLDAVQRAAWLAWFWPCLQAADPDANVVEIDFGRLP